ncbi:MAG: phosphoribosylamine--glycine ligase [Patescibacteria group bacterium]
MLERINVLVVGGGGREHALAWKINQSLLCGDLFIAPGNAGTAKIGKNIDIPVMDFPALAAFAKEHNAFTVVGPDDPLAAGIVDYFHEQGLFILGPTKKAAQIESSKVLSKQLMDVAKIPTAAYSTFSEYDEALMHVVGDLSDIPLVIKASGLALGKGSYICHTLEEKRAALKAIMVERVHGDAGNQVVIEELLEGSEISAHALVAGADIFPFPFVQDHKHALDGNRGPMTGGMGTVGPIDLDQGSTCAIIARAVRGMESVHAPFSGLLFPGLMLTTDGPKVLEFNARFGDPETQVLMRLMMGDFLALLVATATGNLDKVDAFIYPGYAANIVMCSGGYPDKYEKGYPIEGVSEAEKIPGVVVFHAGTAMKDGQLVTNGGRVLGVSAVGDTLQDAIDTAYAAVDCIHFNGKYFRRDIGQYIPV